MNDVIFNSYCENDTTKLGAAIAELLPPGTVVALSGTLGAGKTRLVQAVAQACNIPRSEVTSPTFVLAQEYHGLRSIYHIDAYRIADEDEFEGTGQQEHFEGTGIVFIEWAERIAGCLPLDVLTIDIQISGKNSRTFTISGTERYSGVLSQLTRIE